MTAPDHSRRAPLNRLATGVPGLDQVLGGGLPEYAFVLIAGDPGTGKTTLAHQIMFALATKERPAIHFTVLGEPPVKMLRYQQQFTFFDFDAVDERVYFVNLSEAALKRDLDALLAALIDTVERLNPAVVVVDSFRTIVRSVSSPAQTGDLQEFLQRLALHLTSWQVTSFLVGEYGREDSQDNPVLTIADGILWLHQSTERNSVVRKLQVLKMRGQAPLPGLHTMRITERGIDVFPRILQDPVEPVRQRPPARLSVGIDAMDEMLGGGIPRGDSVLVAGPAGSGKTSLTTQFVASGLRQGEHGVIAIFEERARAYVSHAKALDAEFDEAQEKGTLEILYLRPLDLSVDEVLLEIQSAVARVGASRLVIDSLAGFELALAPTFREDFRESLYRLVNALTGRGVTVMMTVEIATSFTDLIFSPNLVSFLADDVILQRYVEIDARLLKVMAVVKMRGSSHSHDLRLYDVTEQGLVIGEGLAGYEGVVTGVARRRAERSEDSPERGQPSNP